MSEVTATSRSFSKPKLREVGPTSADSNFAQLMAVCIPQQLCRLWFLAATNLDVVDPLLVTTASKLNLPHAVPSSVEPDPWIQMRPVT